MSDPFYQTLQWWKIRAAVRNRWKLAKYPCWICKKPLDWVTKGAVHVDHEKARRTHPELALSAANLKCVCSTCHNSVKKRQENGQVIPKIGLDGWPEL